MASSRAPVALFVYNRPEEARRVIEALCANKMAPESDLFVFSDAARNPEAEEAVRRTRELLSSIQGFRKVEVVLRESNFGLAKSIIEGASRLIRDYGKVVCFEDDLLTSPHALTFLNEALDAYAAEPRVFTVSAYNHASTIMPFPAAYKHDVYFSPRNFSYAWGIWKDRWKQVDWEVEDYAKFMKDRYAQRMFNEGGEDLTAMLVDQMEGRVNSWSIRVTYAQFRLGKWMAAPVHSYVQNLGFAEGGTHGRNLHAGHVNDLSLAKPHCEFPAPFLDPAVMESFRGAYRRRLRTRAKLAVLKGLGKRTKSL